MNEKEKKKDAILAFLSYLVVIHPDHEMSDNLLKAYEFALDDYSFDQVTKALKVVMTSEKFWPTPAHIIIAMTEKKNEKIECNAAGAWATVLDTMSRVGMYQTPKFADKAIPEAINLLGGWQQVCQSNKKELHFLKKNFYEEYRAAVRRGWKTAGVERSIQGGHAGEPGTKPKEIACGYLDQSNRPLLGEGKEISDPDTKTCAQCNGMAKLSKERYGPDSVARFVCDCGYSWVQLRANMLLGGE